MRETDEVLVLLEAPFITVIEMNHTNVQWLETWNIYTFKPIHSYDYWNELFEWNFLKYFSVCSGLLTCTIGIVLLYNIIEYNSNRHIM